MRIAHHCTSAERGGENSDLRLTIAYLESVPGRPEPGWYVEHPTDDFSMQVWFCPFCGVDLKTVPLAEAWCTSCSSPCHCGPRNGHDCVHPPPPAPAAPTVLPPPCASAGPCAVCGSPCHSEAGGCACPTHAR